MLEIKARRRLATVYTCPGCGSTYGCTASTITKRNREYTGGQCFRCNRAFEIVAQRQYTVFASDFSTVAGTLDKLGPFKICDIVHPNIRAFRKWYQERTAELAEQARVYYEHEKVVQAAYEARLKRQREEAKLLKEAEQIAYRRDHAIELLAEEVARNVWPEEEKQFTGESNLGGLDDDWPF